MDPRSSLTKTKSSRRVSSFTAEMPLIWLIGASNLPSPVMTRTFLPLYHWNTSGCILTNTKNLSTCWFTKSSSNCMIFQINAPTQSFGRFLPLFFRACYEIYDNDGNSFPAFCDLKSEPGIAWTLVMSWSRENRVISAFKNAALQVNAPENENSPNYDRYRLSLERMRSLQVHFTHWRATCSYPTHGIDFTDYLRGNFKDFDIVDFQGHGECKRVKYWISEGTMARTLQHRFGRERTLGCCIMTAVWFSASSTQPLEQYQMKTTLASMKALIPSSAVHRQTTLLLSGGLQGHPTRI